MNKMKKHFYTILILIVIIGCSSQIKLNKNLKIGNNDWTTFGGTNFRTNYIQDSIKQPIIKVWNYQGSAGISSNQPLIADSILFIGFMNGELHAININTGKKIGKINLDGAIHGAPVITNNTIYIPIAFNKYSLRAYDIHDGVLLWKKEIDGIESSLLLSDNHLYAATEDGLVLCINPKDGKTIWEFKAPKKIYSSISSDVFNIYFGCDDGYLYSLNKDNGKLLWKFFTSSSIRSTPAIDFNGNIYFGSLDKYFYSVKSDNGIMNWKYNTNSGIISGCALDSNFVYFGNLSGKFFCLDKTSGSLKWSFNSKGNINASPIVTKEHIAFSSYDKKVYILNKFSGELFWSAEFEGRIKTSPLFWRNYLIICYEDYDIEVYQY